MSLRLARLAGAHIPRRLSPHVAGAASAPTPAQEGELGMRPQDLHGAYSLPAGAASPQTIAIVDAYNDPTAEADLKAYEETFAIPCTAASECFRQVNERGGTTLPFPKTLEEREKARKSLKAETRREAEEALGWDLEISLDIETARAVCQSCRILLVEAEKSFFNELETAERTAETLGANEISNSWGGPELGESVEAEATSPFDHPGTVITASAGDEGYLSWANPEVSELRLPDFPSSSPHVVAVGGTRLKLNKGAWGGETVWNGQGATGGGCSQIFSAPEWQLSLPAWSAVGCEGGRSVSDVSADADPYTGLAVLDTSPECVNSWEDAEHVVHKEHWCPIGGTSLSSPLIASVFALAGGSGGAAYPGRTLYENAARVPSSLHDVTQGSNGECNKAPTGEGLSGCSAEAEAKASCNLTTSCLAASGYDGPSGLGTPNGLQAFQYQPPEEAEHHNEEGQGGPPPGEVTPPGSLGSGTTTAPAGSSPPPAGATSPPPAAGTVAATLRVTALSLTRGARAAVRRGPLRGHSLPFLFTASAGGVVRATLLRRVRHGARSSWVRTAGPMQLSARTGANGARIALRRTLRPGVYELTVGAPGAPARTLRFRVA